MLCVSTDRKSCLRVILHVQPYRKRVPMGARGEEEEPRAPVEESRRGSGLLCEISKTLQTLSVRWRKLHTT